MESLKNKNIYIIAIILCIAALFWVIILQFMKDQPEPETVDTRIPQTKSESFVFFDLGVNTIFNKEIRQKLINQLGPDRLETWSPIDLEMHEPGFLKKIFPDLHEMNLRLNLNGGLDVGKNTIKITYRYAINKNLPFYYIKLVFSNYTKKPLFFRIKSKIEGGYVIDTIREKYGEPRKINWGGEEGYSLIWEKNQDILTISKVEDRIGNPEYQIMIYYVENIKELLRTRDEIIKQRRKEKTETGRTAF